MDTNTKMNTSKKILLMLLFVSITSCSTDGAIKKLKVENNLLQKEVSAYQKKVTSYQGKVATLELQLKDKNTKIQELDAFSSDLNKEKASRVEDSSNLRAEVRQFIRREMDDFRDFFKNSDIADYVGGELIERPNTSGSNLTIIDFKHPLSKKGRLLGATMIVSQPTVFSVLVFRRVGNDLIVLWKSEPFKVVNSGRNKVGFKLDVTVEKGDLLGFSFPEKVGVPYNNKTGDTGIIEGQLHPGKLIELSQIEYRSEKRNYSAGVYGFFYADK